MLRYLARRLLLMVPVLIGITFIVFALLAFAPGSFINLMLSSGVVNPDAIARIRVELGTNQPWEVRYLHYLASLAHGNLGRSIVFDQPVGAQIVQALPNTLILTVAATVFATSIAVVAGTVSAVKRNTPLDYGAMLVSVGGVSVPSFWLGLVLLLWFGLGLRWLPIGGIGTLSRGPWDFVSHLILPTVTLGAELAALLTRLVRNTLLDVLSEDYIRTARAKGLAGVAVLSRHALKNALLPVVTTVGVQFGGLLGGAVIIETIYGWPGMGLLTVTAIQQRDLPVVQGTVLVFAICFVLVILATDLLYVAIDPRITYA
jgi:ABC-type dipeptide/oligopeptide/nickel transport system permease component